MALPLLKRERRGQRRVSQWRPYVEDVRQSDAHKLVAQVQPEVQVVGRDDDRVDQLDASHL